MKIESIVFTKCPSLYIPVNTFGVYTPEEYNHNHTWLTTHRDLLGFSVRACADVRVALAEVPGVLGAGASEVVIGDASNDKTSILKNMESNEVGQEVSSPNVLNCDQYRVCVLIYL